MTNLTVYRFTLNNRANEQQVLSFYNEEEDLLETMDNYCSHIHMNAQGYIDGQGKYRTFCLSNRQSKDYSSRIISGYIASAYTGEYGKIQDRKTSTIKYDILKADLFSKDFFYLIHVPKNSKYGFFIFQKKENHGVKLVFERTFNSFMRSKGVSNYSLDLKQAPARYLISNYLKFGKLKEFRLIGAETKSTFESMYMSVGREDRVVKLNRNSDNEAVKNILIKLFDNFSQESKISFMNYGEFDEIAFLINHNGSSKTFYIRDREKIRANVNVTTMVDFVDGEATYESLIKVCLELINSAA